MMTEPRGPSRAFTAFVVAASAVAWLGFAAELVLWVPRHQQSFAGVGLKVPWLTATVFEFALLVADFWWLVVPAGVAGLALLTTAFVRARHVTRWPLLASLLVVLLLGLPVAGLMFVEAGLGPARASLSRQQSK
jgi:type II secretory pathway component PulF